MVSVSGGAGDLGREQRWAGRSRTTTSAPAATLLDPSVLNNPSTLARPHRQRGDGVYRQRHGDLHGRLDRSRRRARRAGHFAGEPGPGRHAAGRSADRAGPADQRPHGRPEPDHPAARGSRHPAHQRLGRRGGRAGGELAVAGSVSLNFINNSVDVGIHNIFSADVNRCSDRSTRLTSRWTPPTHPRSSRSQAASPSRSARRGRRCRLLQRHPGHGHGPDRQRPGADGGLTRSAVAPGEGNGSG